MQSREISKLFKLIFLMLYYGKDEIRKFHITIFIKMVEGKIIQFRRGRKTIIEKHFLIEIKGISNRKEAEKMVGKEVIWSSPSGKKITGKISAPHGGKGLVRAIFERGLPGQAVTTKVEVK